MSDVKITPANLASSESKTETGSKSTKKGGNVITV